MDKDLKTPTLAAIRTAENALYSENRSKVYLPITGPADYIDSVGSLIFGERFDQERGRIFGSAAVGGTSALRLAGELMRASNKNRLFLSNPTWENHKNIFTAVGLQIASYPYYDEVNHRFDFDGMLSFLNKTERGSLVLLHAVCHNPSGVDPNLSQWRQISRVMKERGLLPLFDFAYQGFGKDLDSDRASIDCFMEDGHEMVVCYSFSKNMGLYAERVGAIFVVCEEGGQVKQIQSQLEKIIRSLYSNPPIHGSAIVAKVLSDPALRKMWIEELDLMRQRIDGMRLAFQNALGDEYSFMKNQVGMFSMLGLSADVVEKLKSEKAIYMTRKARVSFAGFTDKIAKIVAKEIFELSR